MIEFKGECGHTIRAKDDDAGKVVRCSYCGREAQVPEEEDELDFLLTEVERTGDFDPPRTKRRAKPRPVGVPPPPIRSRREFNPFSVALKMCYAALIITVLIVVGKGVYKQVVVGPSPSGKEAAVKPSQDAGAAPAPAPGVRDTPARGLLATRLNLNQNGIYVASVPRGAEVYVRDAGRTSSNPLWKEHSYRCQAGEAGAALEMGAGNYDVAVTLQLTDPGLRNLPGYTELREAIEDPTDKNPADEKLARYFIPHGQKSVSLGTLSDQSRIIVMHYNVDVDQKSWTPCTALFLPAETPLSDLMNYLPKGAAFGFDEDTVRGELSIKKVPGEEQKFIVDALHQVGMIPYRKDARSPYQLFFIRLVEGTVSSRPVPEPKKKSG